MAKADEKAAIPSMGFTTSPPADATSKLPTIGPVQEKDTSTNVNAMKKIPAMPPCSDLASALFISELGSTISNRPRKDRPKIKKMAKNKIFGSQCVLTKLAKAGPLKRDTTVPMST